MSGLPSAREASAPPAPRAPAGVRAYLAISQGWSRAGALLQAMFDGVWLGILGRDSLYHIDEQFYDRNAAYHGDAHNLRGLFTWEEAALDDAFAGCGRLLVLGAGGGREVLALARRGCDVDGYECNQALVDYAAEFLPRHGCAATVRYLARDAVPAADAPYDGVIIGWSAYMLIPGRARRIDLLRRLLPLASPGAPVLLSFWTRGGDGVRFRVSAAVANLVRAVLRRERVQTGDALQPNYVHYFTAPEVAAELREAGWEPYRYTPAGSGSRDSAWAIGRAPRGDAGPAASISGEPARTG